MAIEDQLRERLRKVEALFFGAATAGERDAAGAAADRLRAKLDEAARRDPPTEMKFTMPDQWSTRLFIALCRRYGFRPFRYSRQRYTTVMVKAPRRLFEDVVWREFNDLHAGSGGLSRPNHGAPDPRDDPRRRRRRRDGAGVAGDW